MGVVTGIPMEFQFGTNWARFSTFAGGVIGQTLAMEGTFAFFLESSFLGLFMFGEKKLGQAGHFFAAFMVFLGSWLSAYFIVATNAWMQHPVAYTMGARRKRASPELLGTAAQPVDPLAVRAHDGRLGRDRLVRDGRGRRVLPSREAEHRGGQAVHAGRRARGTPLLGPDRVPDRRHERQERRPASARNASRPWKGCSGPRKAPRW